MSAGSSRCRQAAKIRSTNTLATGLFTCPTLPYARLLWGSESLTGTRARPYGGGTDLEYDAETFLITSIPSWARNTYSSNSMAYVVVSRGAYDAQFFTNDREKLGAALGHDVSHRSAHMPEVKQEQAIAPQREIGPRQEQGPGLGN